MKHIILILLALSLIVSFSHADEESPEDVNKIFNTLIEACKDSDYDKYKSVFAEHHIKRFDKYPAYKQFFETYSKILKPGYRSAEYLGVINRKNAVPAYYWKVTLKDNSHVLATLKIGTRGQTKGKAAQFILM